MIYITHSISGAEIGKELAGDAEEAIWALEELADAPGGFFDDIADLIAGTTAEKISAFAKRLADTIDNRA